jgi:hypothetical protein
MEVILELLKLAVVGLIAGLFSSMLANKDHRQRNWWELRVAAYKNAIEALSDLAYYYDENWTEYSEAMTARREVDKESQAKFDAYLEQAFHKIRKSSDSGAFLFSEEANAALREFMRDEASSSEYWEHLYTGSDKAKKCLTRLVECSKIDLQLKPSWLGRLVSIHISRPSTPPAKKLAAPSR